MVTATKAPKLDAALAAAVDVAASALTDEAGADAFGEHLGCHADGERVVTHLFAAAHRGYAGWRWAVTVTRAPRQKTVTVNEVVLIPGDTSLTAPAWVPWKDRVAKGDLGPGDLVPVNDDDPRLVAGFLVGDEPLDARASREVREVTREVGLGRERVLSIEGRDDAADRWLSGDNGPNTPIALAAPAQCSSCGFLVRMGGALSTMFGVCANGASPSDGQAVAFGHGCGAHSDVRVEQSHHQPSSPIPVHDTLTWDAWGDAELEIIQR